MSDKLSVCRGLRNQMPSKHNKLKCIGHLLVIFWLSTVCAQAQVTLESRKLESRQTIESKLAGGESHTYQITLQTGQFLHVVVEQKALSVALVLAAPDSKQVLEVNLTPAGGLESISAEATASGDYRLTVRAGGSAAIAGSYQVRLEVKAAATAQDRQRIAAERLMLEANELRGQGGKTAEQTIDKLQAGPFRVARTGRSILGRLVFVQHRSCLLPPEPLRESD